MKIWSTEENIRAAAERAGVTFYAGLQKDGRGFSLRLALADNLFLGLDDKRRPIRRWQRVAVGFGAENKDGSMRRVNAVCWHGHYAFMSALLAIDPNARIQTAMADYRGVDDFYSRADETGYRNIGSAWYPTQAREACLCAERGDYMTSAYDLGFDPESKQASDQLARMVADLPLERI